MLIELAVWWYGKGYVTVLHKINQNVLGIWRMFSITILLRTLFNPWKRIISPPGKSLDAMMHAMVDNLISRVVGFVVRLLVLTAAFVVTTLAAAVGAALAAGWLLLPPATVYFVVRIFTP